MNEQITNKIIKIVRSNLNIRQSARFLLLEAGALEPDTCAPKKIEPNPLNIANTILALKKPDELLKWLGSEGNLTKLIKFIIAVCNKYNELAVNYNNLDVEHDKELLALKNQKKTVIQYFEGHNADLAAESKNLRTMQGQSIVDFFIVDPSFPVNHVANKKKQHKPSSGPSATTSTTAKPRCLKLQNSPKLTDRKNDISVEHWLAKIEDKMTADQDLMDTSIKRIIYVMNRIDGKAFSHPEPRAWKNASNP